jgi:hypothetical protein
MKKIFLTSICVICTNLAAYSTPFVWEYYDDTFYDETGGLGPGEIQAGGLTGISDVYYKYYFDAKDMTLSQTEWLSDGAGDEYPAPYDSNFFYSNLYLGNPGYIGVPETVNYVEDVNNPGNFIVEIIPEHIEELQDWLLPPALETFQSLAQRDIDFLIDKILENAGTDTLSKSNFDEIKQEILDEIFSGTDITSLDIYNRLYNFATVQNANNKMDNMLAILNSLQNKLDSMDAKISDLQQELAEHDNRLNFLNALFNSVQPRSATVSTGVSRTVNTIITNQVSVRVGSVMGTGTTETNVTENVETFDAGFASHLGNTVENDYYEWKTMDGVSFWGQGLANYSEKSGKDTFNADTYGVTLGVDKKIGDNKLFGMGYTFSNTRANSENANTDITGSQVFLYGEYRPITSVYIDGILSYGVSEYKTDMNVNKSDYDVSNFGLNLKTGYEWDDGFGAFFGTNYMNINQKSYTDYMGQRIAKNNSSVLTLTAGGQYRTNIQDFLIVNLRANAVYDALTPNAKTNVDINGISYQIIGENIARIGFQSGISLDKSIEDWTFDIGYDFEWRNNFISHTGRIKIRKTF